MTEEQLRELVFRVIGDIAPEAELDQLDADADFREELDLDSMDLLNVAIALHEETGIEIPEIDYPKVTTLNTCVQYFLTRSA